MELEKAKDVPLSEDYFEILRRVTAPFDDITKETLKIRKIINAELSKSNQSKTE